MYVILPATWLVRDRLDYSAASLIKRRVRIPKGTNNCRHPTGEIYPPAPQQDLRDLTRYRTKLLQERVRVVSRVQKVLECANIKLSSVATNIFGMSGRAMLEAIVEGHADPETMVQLAKGRLRNKLPQLEKALTGLVCDHHRFLISMQLTHIDFLDEQIVSISTEIEHQICEMDCSQPPFGTNSGEAIPESSGSSAFVEHNSWCR